jgi:hypothetical protein
MNDDTIERALSEPGPREAGYEPAVLPLGSDLPQRRPQGWSVLAAARMGMLAAAVVAGASLAIVLTRPGSAPAGQGTGAGSASPSAVASASAAESTPPAALPACTTADFAWSTDAWGGAAGSTGTTVVVRGVAGLTGCQIKGSALIELRGADGQAMLSVQAPASDVVVHANTLLQVGISWSNWCAPLPSGPLSMTLTLPGDSRYAPLTPASGSITVPPCSGDKQPSVLNATDFQPSDRTAPEG